MAIDTIKATAILDGAVDTADLADGAVTTAKITDGEVTFAKLNADAQPTPTQVSDQSNTSTGAFDIPAGTTAQRPVSPDVGYMRFNTTLGETEIYDGTEWKKINPTTVSLSSISGTIYNTLATDLTLTGVGFMTANLQVSFTPDGGSATTVTVTPTSDSSATVSIPAAIYGESSGTDISIQVTNDDGGISGALTKTVVTPPSGGDTINISGGYRIHTFTSTGNFVVASSLSDVEYVVIAGGGGSASSTRAGGGGAGGYRSSVSGESSGGGASAENKLNLSAGTYLMSVGTGGAGGVGYEVIGSDGTASTIASTLVTTVGGGGGGRPGITSSARLGRPGGSGGGGGGYGASGPESTGGAGTSGEGYAGGAGGSASTGSGDHGGGGGGAGGAGVGHTSNLAGGVGVESSITGTAIYRAGGGGGSDNNGSSSGPGGNGGGGSRSVGEDGKGGGGGAPWGSSENGYAGGDGVIIVRYAL